MTGLLNTNISGLISAQRALETTSHNIANVNKEGYSRQRVEIATRIPLYTGSGYVGRGANVENISRSHSAFLDEQLRKSASALGEMEQYSFMSAKIDNQLADPNLGVTPALTSFFDSVNGLADDPASTPARQVMVTETDILVHRLHTMNDRLVVSRDQLNTEINVLLQDLNSFSDAIADLNVQIISALGKATGEQQPNDLMDERDQLLVELSKKVDINVVDQDNGAISVFLGQGQAVVLGADGYHFSSKASEFDANHLDIVLDNPGAQQVVTSAVRSGEMAGYLRFRDEVLDPAQKKLGLIAAGLAMDFNQIHQNGYDIDGNPGERYFDFGNIEVPVQYSQLNTGNAIVTVSYSDPDVDTGASGRLDFSDYTLDYDAVSGYSLTRNEDNTSIPLTLTGTTLTPTNVGTDYLPGISIEISAGAADGDSYQIRPAFDAAGKIQNTFLDTNKIAAATNVEVDPETGQDVLVGGVPVIINGPMPGDNRNVILLADLANKSTLKNGTAGYTDISAEVIADVGSLTHAANIATHAQEVLYNQARGEREGLVGVNLDEEAANLIKFQQSYQASAQAISVSTRIFDSLISAVRG